MTLEELWDKIFYWRNRRYEGPFFKCTYCGNDKFDRIQITGRVTDILCCNEECRHWFRYQGGILPMIDLYAVDPRKSDV